MNLQPMAVTPLSYFQSLVKTDTDFPLLEAAASIAQDEEPSIDTQDVLATCDALLVRLRRRLKSDADPFCVEPIFLHGAGISGQCQQFLRARKQLLERSIEISKRHPDLPGRHLA